MAALATAQAQATLFSPVGRGAGVSSGVRQALALVGGAVETNDTIRREARFVERRALVPFKDDPVDIRAVADKDETPAPETPRADDAEIRKLSLTGLPAAEQPVTGRGALVDIKT